MGFADSDPPEGSHPTVAIGLMDPISRFLTTLLNFNCYLQERGRQDKALGYISAPLTLHALSDSELPSKWNLAQKNVMIGTASPSKNRLFSPSLVPDTRHGSWNWSLGRSPSPLADRNYSGSRLNALPPSCPLVK